MTYLAVIRMYTKVGFEETWFMLKTSPTPAPCWDGDRLWHPSLWISWLKSLQNVVVEYTIGSNMVNDLTHWGRVTHICVSKIIIIGSDNGSSPGRRQVIIWTNAGILLIEPLRTRISEILIEIHTFSFKKIHLKMSSGKWRLYCLGLNVLKCIAFAVMANMLFTVHW